MKEWRKIITMAIFVVLLAFWSASPANTQSLAFYQLDFDLDGTITTNSDWGEVDLTFTGSTDILYFNLAINGTWQVQNIPVLSIEGSGVSQAMRYCFDLGVAPGTDVTTLNYDYTLTTTTQASMPGGSYPASVQDRSVIMYSGVAGVDIPPLLAPAPLVGGEAKGGGCVHPNLPNQECGKDECVPAAVSNSLQFLNTKYKLGIAAGDITINKMKQATNWGSKTMASAPGPGVDRVLSPYPASKPDPWTKKGCWIDHDNNAAAGEKNAWWEDKDAYMKAHNLPITTTKVTSMAEIYKEVCRCQDVELMGDWHAAAIVGITPLAGGKYSIDVAHDTKQGQAGGTEKPQSIKYDPATNKFSGSPGFFDGSTFRYGISECPETTGGIGIPIDKFSLLAPYFALTSAILVITAVYFRRRKKKQS